MTMTTTTDGRNDERLFTGREEQRDRVAAAIGTCDGHPRMWPMFGSYRRCLCSVVVTLTFAVCGHVVDRDHDTPAWYQVGDVYVCDRCGRGLRLVTWSERPKS